MHSTPTHNEKSHPGMCCLSFLLFSTVALSRSKDVNQHLKERDKDHLGHSIRESVLSCDRLLQERYFNHIVLYTHTHTHTHTYLINWNCYCVEKDTIVLDYEQKIRLLAFFKQEKLGPFSADKDSDTGYFDVVGSHRRYRMFK